MDGKKWECIAITLEDYNAFLDTIKKSRHADEKNLKTFIIDEVLPLLQEREEHRQRNEMRRLKELTNLTKLATAKRSGRLAQKAEKQKEQEEIEEAERRRMAEIEMAHREQNKQRRLEDVSRN
jgi:hypothetical protein